MVDDEFFTTINVLNKLTSIHVPALFFPMCLTPSFPCDSPPVVVFWSATQFQLLSFGLTLRTHLHTERRIAIQKMPGNTDQEIYELFRARYQGIVEQRFHWYRFFSGVQLCRYLLAPTPQSQPPYPRWAPNKGRYPAASMAMMVRTNLVVNDVGVPTGFVGPETVVDAMPQYMEPNWHTLGLYPGHKWRNRVRGPCYTTELAHHRHQRQHQPRRLFFDQQCQRDRHRGHTTPLKDKRPKTGKFNRRL